MCQRSVTGIGNVMITYFRESARWKRSVGQGSQTRGRSEACYYVHGGGGGGGLGRKRSAGALRGRIDDRERAGTKRVNEPRRFLDVRRKGLRRLFPRPLGKERSLRAEERKYEVEREDILPEHCSDSARGEGSSISVFALLSFIETSSGADEREEFDTM